MTQACFRNRFDFSLRRRLAVTLVAAAALAAGSVARAQGDPKDIPDPDPEIERQSFQVADGFEVSLFAADPLLAKPIEMAFDADGRLWIASSEIYPQVKPGQQADDKILVLEDRDGDGKAEKSTVFAGGLLIPTGIEPAGDGAYVANSTEILFLKDTDGDGKADFRRVMLSGFGTEDTHHIVHTLRWGPDGMLYFNQSVYIHSHLETPYGVRRLAGGGIWQFRPETMELDVFMRGAYNSWGHAWDYWGQSFASDGAGPQGMMFVFPGATFEPSPGASRFLPGLNPGSPKYCGLEIVSGRQLPDAWQGSLITCDFRAHRVCRFVVTEDGAGFASREQSEVIKSTHPAFRPIDVKLGPDGAIYVADWYNPIIQHGEVDFRDPRRDHTHGRIWRVTAQDRPLVERPKLTDATTAALLAELKSPEGWTRQFAKQVIKQRGADVVPELDAWVIDLPQAHPEYEHYLLEGLWTYQSLCIVEPKLLERLLHAKDPHARAAAVRVLGQWQARLGNPLEMLESLVVDDHPRVRLEAVRALATLGTAEAAQVAMRALDKPMDRFLEHALYLTARDLQPVWLPALERGALDFGGDSRQLAFALNAAGSVAAVGPLLKLIRSDKLPPQSQVGALVLLTALGGPAELKIVLDEVLAEKMAPAARAELLRGLVQAARQRKLKPAGELDQIKILFDSTDETLRLAAVESAGAWQLASLFDQLAKLGTKPTDWPVCRAALQSLGQLGTPESKAWLLDVSGSISSGPLAVEATIALAATDPTAAAKPAVNILMWNAIADPRPFVGAFLDRKGGGEALIRALQGQKISPDAAKLAIRGVRESAIENPELVAALTAAGGLTDGPHKLSPEEARQLVADVATQGDAARGEAVFRRADLSCLKCHSIGPAGGRVGPDLASLGASAQPDYILESILEPSAKIKENYHSLVVTTDEGRVWSGIKIGEVDKKLILRDAEDRELSIPVDSIEEQKLAGSLMPIGLPDGLTRAELVDLVRFLSELGKVGPYAVGNARVVRRWQVLADMPAANLTGLDALATSDALQWNSAYSNVSGELPTADIPALKMDKERPIGVVRFQIDVTTAGAVRLELPAAAIRRRFWVDGVASGAPAEETVDLTVGQHTITLAIYPAAAKSLRVELRDAAGSKAQVQIVGGK